MSGLISVNGVGFGFVNGFLFQFGARKLSMAHLREDLATQSFQLFLISTDGSFCFPLGFVPSRSLSGPDIYSLMSNIIEMFEQEVDGNR